MLDASWLNRLLIDKSHIHQLQNYGGFHCVAVSVHTDHSRHAIEIFRLRQGFAHFRSLGRSGARDCGEENSRGIVRQRGMCVRREVAVTSHVLVHERANRR